jgi:hypothetical protein
MKKIAITLASLFIFVHFSKAQTITILRVPSPSVPVLAIPFSDARHAALGDAGVATSTDFADIFYNPAKTAFANTKFGFYGSYPSFYSSQDNYVPRVGVYYKIPKNKGTVSINYTSFDFYCPPNANCIATPFDWALGVNYSKKLSSKFSYGFGLKYVKSIFPSEIRIIAGVPLQPATTIAADISIFHQDTDSTKLVNLNYGVYISNLSGRINYGGKESNFIPTNLKIGIAPTLNIDKHNTLTLAIDANKLMIPTPIYDSNRKLISAKTAIGGILGSFSDAPDGLSEELQEIIWSIGFEYWYDKKVALRIGKFIESENKGGRNFTTFGVGVKIIKRINVDLAYMQNERINWIVGNLWRGNITFGIGKINK